jgi:hypothetical protein
MPTKRQSMSFVATALFFFLIFDQFHSILGFSYLLCLNSIVSMNHNMDFAPFGHGPGPEVINNEKKTLLEALIKVFM